MYEASARQMLSMDFAQDLVARQLNFTTANHLLQAITLGQGQEYRVSHPDMSIVEFLCHAGDVPQEILRCSLEEDGRYFRFKARFGEGILPNGRRFILDVTSTTPSRHSSATIDAEALPGSSGSPIKIDDIPESVLQALARKELSAVQMQSLWLVNVVAKLGIDFTARAAA